MELFKPGEQLVEMLARDNTSVLGTVDMNKTIFLLGMLNSVI